ncbi:MAG: TerB family tellurite resistance protein [Deltaproteobacteria bacterium]|nr:TerB family tellurite resistance protein [Deltaproteobacteria bacterium]
MTTVSRTGKPLQSNARSLQDAFFLEQDKILIEKLRAMKKMAENKQSLAAISGITNDVILTRLVELGITPETVAALTTVPLIEVAWADGSIDDKERLAVLAHASTRGIKPGTVEHDLLERWLQHRPEPKLLEAWQTYVRGLAEHLSDQEKTILRDELLHATRAAAEASGGFLGVGKISKPEQAMLETLAKSF